MEITHHQDLGPKPRQEDRFFARVIQNQYIILAVFDGHGYCGHEIPEACVKYLENLDYQDISEDTLLKIVKDLQKIGKNMLGGSTCSICIIADKAYVAILGDSPVWIMDSKGKIHDFRTHNVSDKKNPDVEIIESRGGRFEKIGRGGYLKGNGGSYLAMTRAIGDMDHNRFLIREPDIYTVEKPISVAVCSDGFTAETKVVEKMLHEGKKAINFFEKEKFLGLNDNFTAVIYHG